MLNDNVDTFHKIFKAIKKATKELNFNHVANQLLGSLIVDFNSLQNKKIIFLELGTQRGLSTLRFNELIITLHLPVVIMTVNWPPLQKNI